MEYKYTLNINEDVKLKLKQYILAMKRAFDSKYAWRVGTSQPITVEDITTLAELYTNIDNEVMSLGGGSLALNSDQMNVINKAQKLLHYASGVDSTHYKSSDIYRFTDSDLKTFSPLGLLLQKQQNEWGSCEGSSEKFIMLISPETLSLMTNIRCDEDGNVVEVDSTLLCFCENKNVENRVKDNILHKLRYPLQGNGGMLGRILDKSEEDGVQALVLSREEVGVIINILTTSERLHEFYSEHSRNPVVKNGKEGDNLFVVKQMFSVVRNVSDEEAFENIKEQLPSINPYGYKRSGYKPVSFVKKEGYLWVTFENGKEFPCLF